MLQPFYQEKQIEAGCDEAGRGCFAGPIYAASVILPKGFTHPFLNDSKQLSEEQRDELRVTIEQTAISYAVASVDNNEIDQINILRASFKAMHLAVERLSQKPRLLLIDGNRFTPYKKVKHHCIIKGDGIYMAIAAASILAKTHRDEYMKKLHQEFPHYSWDRNKGYGTAAHRQALKEFGICKYHRKSFRIMEEQPLLFEEKSGEEKLIG